MHHSALPAWAIEPGRAFNDFDAINPARTALVVIDMQSVFVAEGTHAHDIIAPVNRLATAMRDAGATIIWTRQTVNEDPPLAMPAWQ